MQIILQPMKIRNLTICDAYELCMYMNHHVLNHFMKFIENPEIKAEIHRYKKQLRYLFIEADRASGQQLKVAGSVFLHEGLMMTSTERGEESRFWYTNDWENLNDFPIGRLNEMLLRATYKCFFCIFDRLKGDEAKLKILVDKFRAYQLVTQRALSTLIPGFELEEDIMKTNRQKVICQLRKLPDVMFKKNYYIAHMF